MHLVPKQQYLSNRSELHEEQYQLLFGEGGINQSRLTLCNKNPHYLEVASVFRTGLPILLRGRRIITVETSQLAIFIITIIRIIFQVSIEYLGNMMSCCLLSVSFHTQFFGNPPCHRINFFFLCAGDIHHFVFQLIHPCSTAPLLYHLAPSSTSILYFLSDVSFLECHILLQLSCQLTRVFALVCQ